MSLKIYFLHTHLENLDASSDEDEEISDMEETVSRLFEP